jgi:hypothetical protein
LSGSRLFNELRRLTPDNPLPRLDFIAVASRRRAAGRPVGVPAPRRSTVGRWNLMTLHPTSYFVFQKEESSSRPSRRSCAGRSRQERMRDLAGARLLPADTPRSGYARFSTMAASRRRARSPLHCGRCCLPEFRLLDSVSPDKRRDRAAKLNDPVPPCRLDAMQPRVRPDATRR